MRQLYTILLIFLFTVSYGQNKFHKIKFKQEMIPFKSSFYFSGIIDNRFIQQNVGFASKGVNHWNVEAQLDGEFEEVISAQINKIIIPNNEGEKVFFIFHELNVSERIVGMSRVGICRMKIEFVKQVDSVYYSLGVHSAVLEKGGLEVTNWHGDRILQGLRACIVDFEKSDWINNPSIKVIVLENLNSGTPITSVPKKGLYTSLEKMAKGEHMEDFEINFNRRRTKGDIPKYDLKIKNKNDKKKKVMFISNGQDLFMHASRYSSYNYYLKAKQVGRYFYFEDKLPNSMAGAMFGLTGTLLSIKKTGIVLDTQTGLVFFTTISNLSSMVKDHPDIVKTYKNSKGKLKDREEVVIALNKKYLDTLRNSAQ